MFSQVSTGRLVEEAHEKLSQGPVAESGYVVDTEAQEQEQEIVTSGRHPSHPSSVHLVTQAVAVICSLSEQCP